MSTSENGRRSSTPPTNRSSNTKGAVTGTEFGRAKIVELNSDSGCGGGPPRPKRFVSEDTERATGCEMTLDVESVLHGGVNRQEALG